MKTTKKTVAPKRAAKKTLAKKSAPAPKRALAKPKKKLLAKGPLPMFRQGDVLVMGVDTKPSGPWKAARREGGRIVLAHGNATGHSHAIAGKTAKLFRPKNPTGEAWRDDALLVVDRTVVLAHEEHAPIKLAKGFYVIRRQREHAPDAIVTVID